MSRSESWYKQAVDGCSTVDPSETIFVVLDGTKLKSDSSLVQTLVDLFEKAACPFRIFIGLCLPEDGGAFVLSSVADTMISHGMKDFSRHIRSTGCDGKPQGPLKSKSMASSEHYKGERYVLHIEVGTVLCQEWDKALIRQLHECPGPKPMLTTEPSRAYDNVPDFKLGTFLRLDGFQDDTGMAILKGSGFIVPPVRPFRSLFWCSEFSFSYGASLLEVPWDPHCPWVDLGSDICMSMRLWTSGWEFFSPTKSLVSKTPGRVLKNLVQTNLDQVEERSSYRRLKVLMGMLDVKDVPETLLIGMTEKYGLGSVKSSESYQDYCGVDFRKQKLFSSRPVLGLSPDASVEESIAKTGKSFQQ